MQCKDTAAYAVLADIVSSGYYLIILLFLSFAVSPQTQNQEQGIHNNQFHEALPCETGTSVPSVALGDHDFDFEA